MNATILEKIEQLPLQQQAEVNDFVERLLSSLSTKKDVQPPRHVLKFDWCDEPSDEPEQYSSVQLQHQVTELMIEKFEKKLEPPVVALPIGEGVILIPIQPLFAKLCDRIAKVFANHQVTAEDLIAGLPETREQVFARLYPQLAANEPVR